MVRNRLAELHKRTGFEETEIIESENQPLKKQFKQHEEEFLNKLQGIISDIDKVDKNVLKIGELQNEIVNSLDPKDEKKKKEELKILNVATKKLAKEIRSALKKEHQETNSKLTHKTIQVESQSRRFQQILKKHNAFQLEFRNKCRVSLIKDARIKGVTLADDEIEEILDKGDVTNLFSTDLQAKRKECEAIETRNNEIQELLKDLEELFEIFKQVEEMVEAQGHTIDNIERDILKAEVNVHNATEALGDAAEYNAKKQKLICRCYIVLAVVAIFLIFYLYFSSESDNSNNQNNVITTNTDKKDVINTNDQNQTITTTTPGWNECMVPPYCEN